MGGLLFGKRRHIRAESYRRGCVLLSLAKDDGTFSFRKVLFLECEQTMTMRGTFRFHPVGQGLFYSGLIQKPEDGNFRQLSFVYDCGSTSSHRFLRREVDDFKELLPLWKNGKKWLDLLVVPICMTIM